MVADIDVDVDVYGRSWEIIRWRVVMWRTGCGADNTWKR